VRRIWSLLLAVTLGAWAWCARVTAAPIIYHLTDLGSLGSGFSATEGMNNSGQVVGYSYTPSSLSLSNAFVYSNGVMTDLGQPYGGDTTAYGINNAGQVVGTGNATVNSHGFIYSDGIFTDLQPFKIYEAYSINSAGQVVGQGGAAGVHAILYSSGTTTDLGTLGGTTSTAYDINDNRQVIGESQTGGVDVFGNSVSHAFLQ